MKLVWPVIETDGKRRDHVENSVEAMSLRLMLVLDVRDARSGGSWGSGSGAVGFRNPGHGEQNGKANPGEVQCGSAFQARRSSSNSAARRTTSFFCFATRSSRKSQVEESPTAAN